MPPHLRNGRDISAEQRLRYQLSPAAEEQLRRARVGLTAVGQGFSRVPSRGTFAAGHGHSPSSVQSEGNVPGASFKQVDACTATRREGTDDSSQNSSLPHPTNPEGLRPGAPPDLSLVPPAQNQAPQDSSGPMELTPEDQEILNLVNLLNEQYKMYVRARETQNARAQRRLLSQAATTQEMMEDIVGREESIRLSQDWIPREDLNALERTLYQQTLDAERRAPPITNAQTNTSLALAPHSDHQPLVATPTPEPPGSRHQAQETNYLGPTPPYAPQAPMPPPYDYQTHQMMPPPPPQQQQMARLPPASTQLDGTQAPRHHPYQRPNAPYH
ncbi:hypothetical protein PTTG_29149 [Puccinia triticina 1-1 BBBD Race 1]|uniref:Uncharacterized protein n=1 Tax=Puccinia triticina (isolate 1-1 / race 1 (BBBD)) TaxID=630390 RepID=A0A180G671_PUCT1|nr:hypothetical protein PTTG_29149 [Puccinia triticina 1-1 BBBD Race 1]